MRLSRDDILKAEDLATEEVDVPEWGGSVLVRGMTGAQRDVFEASVFVQHAGKTVRDLANTRAKIVARCVVGEDGELMFTDSDVAALGEKSGAALDRVFEVAARLSGMQESDVKEMTADFGQAAGNGSSSPSPRASARRSANSSAR